MPNLLQIREFLNRHNLSPVSVSSVGTGKFNASYAIRLEKPADFKENHVDKILLRIAPHPDTGFIFYERDMMKQEPRIHQLLKEKTDIPVPEIFVYDESRSIFPADAMIMEYLSGIPVSDLSISQSGFNRVLKQTGTYLRQLHDRVQEDRYGYLGEHNCMVPQDNWKSAFSLMWNSMMDDIHNCGVYSEQERDHAKEILVRHLNLFAYKGPSRLLHMDIWSQNILVDDESNITGVLDWDRALWGDPEIEYAVLDYVGFNKPAFWNGYGRTPALTNDYEIRRSFYHLYEVQKYLIIWTLRRTGQEMRVRQYRDYALGVLGKLASL